MIDLSHISSKRQAEQENRFTLWGHTFSVDPDMIPYNSIRKQFRGLPMRQKRILRVVSLIGVNRWTI